MSKKPTIKQVVHINFIEYKNYINQKYNIKEVSAKFADGYSKEVNYYRTCIVDSHMFRGNDSSKKFFNQFMEETISEDYKPVFDFLSEKIKNVVFKGKGNKKQNEEILSISEKEWITAYIQVLTNSQEIINKLGKDDEYYFQYMVAGLFESSVMSSYKITDYHKESYGKYFWYISW